MLISCPKNPLRTLSLPRIFANFKSNEPLPTAGSYTLFTSVFILPLLSRSEIFEDFIYRKIDKERDKKYPKSENYTIKRVLEELALVMKIFQVSQISKDEFFTIFKELNLGNIFTGDGLIEKLCDRSLLKDNIDYLEFENQELLDYLASKELSRFEKIEQVFFDIAVEPHLKEVYTPWFYVMPFILEQNPNMINIILDFLEKNSNN